MSSLYHVAICDDDREFMAYVKRIIGQVKKDDEEISFYEYTSGEELIDNLDGGIQYDLLILDMQMGEMDGDETARCFRQKYPDAVLSFCSGACMPSVASFKATPFRYLLKSYTDEKFMTEMREILDEVGRNLKESYVIGHYRNSAIRVKIRNILYIENAKRGSRIVVSDNSEEAGFEGVLLLDEKLRELAERFEELEFAHNSYIVNIDHVEYVAGNELLLDSGEHLSISRAYQKSFREIFTKHIANKYK